MAETTGSTSPTSLAERPAVRERLDRARDRLQNIDTTARKLVREKPIAVVGTLLLLGYALGRLLARR